MAVATKEYKKLCDRFPLRPIKNVQDKTEATEVMMQLSRKGKGRTDDETDYLVVLSKLIIDYEENMPEVQELMKRVRKITPVDALQSLMNDHGLTQSQLAKEAGIDQGNLSAFLAGRRNLSPMSAFRLARRFKLSLDAFIR